MDDLRTEKLVKKYGKVTVVKDVSLTICPGEVVFLLGGNGAGKSTTFRMVVGLVKPNQGKIYFRGQDISRLPMYERARLGIGYLPQEPTVFSRLTVAENVEIVLENTKMKRPDRKKKIHELLEEMSLMYVIGSKAGDLSGGERRRLEIARTLAINPSLVMLDEPFAAIDPKVVENLQQVISQLKERGLGILITDHKPLETLSISDRGYVMEKGNILREGSSKEIFNDPMVREAYLGENFSGTNELLISTEKCPESAISQKAQQQMDKGEYQNAISTFTDAIAQKPKDEQNYFHRGHCFYMLHDWNSAWIDLSRAQNMGCQTPQIQKLLSDCQKKKAQVS